MVILDERTQLILKSRLIRSRVGHAIFRARKGKRLHSLPMSNPEHAGMVSNELIADTLVTRIAPKGGTFIDVGAHLGTIFSFAQRHDPTLTIYAFEAQATKYEVLTRLYPYARIYNVAIGEEEGETSFYVNPHKTGYNSLLPSEGLIEQQVRLATIDGLLPHVSPDVIKIDIEGAELGALRGAGKAIARGKPTIMFECVLRQENALGYSAEKIWKWFAERDYGIYSPDRVAHGAPHFSKEVFCDGQHYPFRSINYFAIAHERREMVRRRAQDILGIAD
jgi:FkbM family methyltransferase